MLNQKQNFPSTHKFFEFRYGILWCARSDPDNNVLPFSTHDIKDNEEGEKIFLQPYNNITNFEFSSTKRSAFVQINNEINVYVGLRNLSFTIGKIKRAQFSSRYDNHLFILDEYNILRLIDIKKKEYVEDFEIENVDNFAIFPKQNEKHYIAIIRKPNLLYIDSIKIKDQPISNFLNSNISPEDLINDGIIPEFVEIGNDDFDIAIGKTDVFIGSNKGEIFAIEEKKKLIDEKIDHFLGFIVNNDIFAITEIASFIVDKKGLIFFFDHRYIACVSSSPQIVACEDETCYIYRDKIISVNKAGDVGTRVNEESLILKRYMNDSFFARVNYVQVRRERLSKRQEEFDEKIKQMIIVKPNDKSKPKEKSQLEKLKEDYEKLRERLLKKIKPYDTNEIEALKRDYNQINGEYNNLKS